MRNLFDQEIFALRGESDARIAALEASSGAQGSTLAYAEVTTNTAFTTAAEVVLVSSATITVPAGRRIKITADAGRPSHPVAGDIGVYRIKEGATVLNRKDLPVATAGVGVGSTFSVVVSPSAGAHTYSLTAQAAGGAGTSNTNAAVGNPVFILVEDITGSVWPQGSAVTTGMVASEAWTDYTPSLWQNVTVGATNVRSRYQRIGRLIVAQFRITATAAGSAGTGVRVGLPVNAASATGNLPAGSGLIFDTSTSTNYAGTWWLDSVTAVALVGDWSGAGLWGQIPSIALGSGDSLAGLLMYEAAS